MGSSQDKGDRNERKAKKILSRFKGVRAETVLQRSSYNQDFLGLADIIGINADTGELYLVQVKTNGNFTHRKMKKFTQLAAMRLDNDLHHFEVWNRIDRKGWEFFRYNSKMEEKAAGHFHHENWGGMEKYAEVREMNDPDLVASKLLERRTETFTEENWMQEERRRKNKVEK